MTDDHHLHVVQLGPARTDRPVVAIETVAVEFHELIETEFEVIGGHGPVGVAGDLDRLPRFELVEDPAAQVGQVAAQATDLGAGIGIIMGDAFELLELCFEFVDWPFEGESMLSFTHFDVPDCRFPCCRSTGGQCQRWLHCHRLGRLCGLRQVVH